MRLYESVFIARQDISSQQVESMADEFAGIITNAGGKIHKREYWGLRSLAYRIKKNRKGHYIMFNLETDGATLKEYERIMGLNEDVLRFLNIRIEEGDEAPSIIMQNKGERGDRSERGERGERGLRAARSPQKHLPPVQPRLRALRRGAWKVYLRRARRGDRRRGRGGLAHCSRCRCQ